MAAKLEFAAEVASDLASAYTWYENQRAGLGEEFLSCVDARLTSICRSPEFHEQIYKTFRRALTRRFPYQIFYEYDGATVTVFGIFHSSQDPDKWQHRLSGQ